MMRATVDISQLLRDLPHLQKQILQGAEDGVEISSNEIAREAARGHPHRKPGARVGDEGRERNPDGSYRYFDRTGNLTGSIRPMDIRHGERRIEGGAVAGKLTGGGGSIVLYADDVEFGTSRNRSFPFMGPAAEKMAPKIPTIIAGAIEAKLK